MQISWLRTDFTRGTVITNNIGAWTDQTEEAVGRISETTSESHTNSIRL